MNNKIFSFLVEPSSYTMNLINNVYKEYNFNTAFLIRKSFSRTNNEKNESIFLSDMNILNKLKFLIFVFRNNRMIIVNGYDNYVFLFIFLLNIITQKKRVIAIESDTQYKVVNGIKGFVKKLYLRTIFRNKYIFGFAGGNFSHKNLFRNYGMLEARLFLMPMMVNNSLFYKKTEFKKSNFTFLFVGRMIPLKNIELLIENFLVNFYNHAHVVLKIVGTGELFQPLKTKYALHKNIHFVGPKYDQDLVYEYHTSDVLVLPSYHEQWGLVVNEALSAALPVITSNKVGASQDLIMGKNTGLIFDLSKKDDLSKKMIQIYEDKSLHKEYSKNAEHIMKEYWNYDLYKKSLLDAISEADKLLS